MTTASVAARPRTAYEASLSVFPDELPPFLRCCALLETLAHLEYLVRRGGLERLDAADGTVAYAAG